jgi:PTH1 family peptidyl-tRNA hydrolase
LLTNYKFSSIKAIIGLGNPGTQYYHTRHSIGFRVTDLFVEKYGGNWSEKDQMRYATVQIGDGKSVHVIQPLTFMNNSGKVIPYLSKKGIAADELLVIHDELEKPFGKIDIRLNGGARGHNGLRSILGVIGKDFWRLQFGIGRPEKKEDVANYVLASFSKQEELELTGLIDKAVLLIGGDLANL